MCHKPQSKNSFNVDGCVANQEHLDILKQGVETWNQWWQEHHDIQPDLSGVDLSEAFLNGATSQPCANKA
jgi:hypothetical protein